MEQRPSPITLGVANLQRARAFFEQLGWAGQEVEETVFIEASGLALVLWSREKLAADGAIPDEGTLGFGGIALAHNLRSAVEVEEIIAAAERAGAAVTRPAAETFLAATAASSPTSTATSGRSPTTRAFLWPRMARSRSRT